MPTEPRQNIWEHGAEEGGLDTPEAVPEAPRCHPCRRVGIADSGDHGRHGPGAHVLRVKRHVI